MYQEKSISSKEVYSFISSGMMAFKCLAKRDLRRRWKNMPMTDKLNAGRALVQMEIVAKDPKNFFSAEHTYNDWCKRAREYAKNKSLPDERAAFYIVPSPVDMIAEKTKAALNAPLSCEYYTFMMRIKDWEYHRVSEKYSCLAVADAQDIVQTAKNVMKKSKMKIENILQKILSEKVR